MSPRVEPKQSSVKEAPAVDSFELAWDDASPYGLSGLSNSQEDIFEAYVTWHNKVVQGACSNSKTPVLLFFSTAGFGDSTQALFAAFNAAVQTGRLFFADWPSTMDALREPPFLWRWQQGAANCNVNRSSPRVMVVEGHLWTGHPLIQQKPFKFEHLRLREGFLDQRLIQPSAPVQSLVDRTLRKLQKHPSGSPRPFIGLQIRTGAADKQSHFDPNTDDGIPHWARFLSPGDERFFIEKAKEIISTRYKNHEDVKIFAMSDSPKVLNVLRREFGDRLVTLKGSVIHSAQRKYQDPSRRDQDQNGLFKVFVDWFVFCHADSAVITHHSLYGSSAARRVDRAPHKDEFGPFVVRIADSQCGTPNHKSC